MRGLLRGEWEEFWRCCFPDGGAAEGQQDEMRRAFYAGAFIALLAVGEQGGAAMWGRLHAEASSALAEMVRQGEG